MLLHITPDELKEFRQFWKRFAEKGKGRYGAQGYEGDAPLHPSMLYNLTPHEVGDLQRRWRLFNDVFTDFYYAPYRGAFERAKRENDDLFMLFMFCELMGVPNPATYYTLELQPIFIEQLDAWQDRMGRDRSIFANIVEDIA